MLAIMRGEVPATETDPIAAASSPSIIADLNDMRAEMGLPPVQPINPSSRATKVAPAPTPEKTAEVQATIEELGERRSLRLPPPTP